MDWALLTQFPSYIPITPPKAANQHRLDGASQIDGGPFQLSLSPLMYNLHDRGSHYQHSSMRVLNDTTLASTLLNPWQNVSGFSNVVCGEVGADDAHGHNLSKNHQNV